MRCCICDKPITGTCWVCDACATQHALTGPLSTWPAWAREMQKCEQADRRYRRNFPTFDELGCDDRYPSERGLSYAWDVLRDMGVGVDG